jgi:hypothetical protein
LQLEKEMKRKMRLAMGKRILTRSKDMICGKYPVEINMGPPLAALDDETAPSWKKMTGIKSYLYALTNKKYYNEMDRF